MSMLTRVDLSFEKEVTSIKVQIFRSRDLVIFGEEARLLWQFILSKAHEMIMLGLMDLRIGLTRTSTSWVLKNR